MAMVIANNMAAQLTLGELNKNNNALGKQLKKVSSGMRINGAGDDASGYAISERMRARIRALDQDTQNVQNGQSLLRVAEGGIQNIIGEIRTLKELALNSANDTNTDADRATIQKEFENRMANINDIATETNYNGKTLLDGTYRRPYTYWGEIFSQGAKKTKTVPGGTRLEWVQVGSKTAIVQRLVRETVPNTVKGISAAFTEANTVTTSQTKTGMYTKNTPSLANCSKIFTRLNDSEWYKKYATPDDQMAVNIDFSGMTNASGDPVNIPNDLNNQGFSILCGACTEQFITIKFDSTTGDSTYSASNPNKEGGITFTIGIYGVSSFDELEDALFNGIKNASGRPTSSANWEGSNTWKTYAEPDNENSVLMDCEHNFRIAKNSSGDGYVFLKGTPYSPQMGIYDMGIVVDTYINEEIEEPVYGYKEVPYDEVIEYYEPIREEGWITDPGQPLVIHHGTKANEAMNVYINDMHTWSLKTNVPSYDDILEIGRLDTKKAAEYRAVLNEAANMTLDDAKVVTQHDANVALRVIDGALDYALNEVTYVGAYISRLGFTESNLVTANENTVSSESTLRDADMAKEMMEYTKANVLAQASQSMLAQANQNSSQVMSLLQ